MNWRLEGSKKNQMEATVCVNTRKQKSLLAYLKLPLPWVGHNVTMFSETVPATCICAVGPVWLHRFMHITIQPNIPSNFISSDSIKSVKYIRAD
jgi:hypothetical protein